MQPARPQFTIIEGGLAPLPPWLNFPPTVAARCPWNRNQAVIFRIAGGDARKAGRAGRRSIVFDLWSMLLGDPPPVLNVETMNHPARQGLTCLADAHACFRGIKRPLANDGSGSSMLAYVVRAVAHYVYEPDLACVARKHRVPADVVFVAYVRLDEPATAGPQGVTGIVTHWQLVEAELAELSNGEVEYLPVGYSTRYDQRLW